MEYQVPQFIEVEDKVFGPFSLKQFIYLAGGIGLLVILFLYLPFFLFLLFGIPVTLFTGALAFYKVNNKSFVELVEAAFNFYTKDRLYLWKKEKKVAAPVQAVAVEPREKLRLTEGRLKDLAWSLDIKDQPGGAESRVGTAAGEGLPPGMGAYAPSAATAAIPAADATPAERGTPGLMNR